MPDRLADLLRSRTVRLATEGLVLAVIFGLLAVYVGRSMYGIDVFWHIRAGELIVQQGAIPEVDTFSAVAPERPWTPFQWLYEVFVYALDEAGGLPLLRLVNALVLLAGFALLYRAVRRETGPLLAVFVLLLTIVLFEDRFRVRPHVFNLLFLALLLPVLFGRWRTIGWKGTLGVGAVAWLWANVHAGGALLVPVTLGGLLAGAVFRWLLVRYAGHASETPAVQTPAVRTPAVRTPGDHVKRAARLFAVAVGPMLLMPGFLQGVVTAVSMYGASVSLIPEWQDPTAYFDLLGQRGMAHYLVCGFAPYVVMIAYGGWVVARVLRRELLAIPWAEVALSVLLLYLSQRSLRFVYLAAVPTTFLLRSLAGHVAAAGAARLRGLVAAGAVALSLGALAVAYHYNVVVQRGSLAGALARLDQDLEPGRFPTEAARFLDEAGVEGGLLHLSKWGGYLLWKLWPEMSVFSDGRGNFDLTQVGALVATHRPLTRREMLEKAWWLYRFDAVMFPAPVFPLRRWEHDRWVRIYAGVEHRTPIEVFLRNDPSNRANLARVRAWYAAESPDPRLRSADLATFERAVGELWGRRWLERPRQQRRLANLAERVAPGRPPAERAEALFERAMLYFTANLADRALADLVAADEARPGDPRVLYYLGWTLFELDREREALGALAAAARGDAQGAPRLRADERSRGELLLRYLMARHPPAGGRPGSVPSPGGLPGGEPADPAGSGPN